ncbi:hypothetical protein A1D22_01110 [Pasteurellaceae bacterium LFhippo2]|nr:hypothetical protein [Pasteurellaceae bacterium LFhippo2]
MKKTALAVLLGGALFAGSAMAHEAGSFIGRVGGVFVEANSSSKVAKGLDVGLEANNNAQLGLTLTYMLTDNVGVELLGATPFSHKVKATLGGETELGNIAKVKHLPPSLYAQYYFLDKNAGSRPYVGVGLNYTRFFSGKLTNTGKDIGLSNLRIKKHSFGPVVNAGIDIKLTDKLSLNTALWYTKIKTSAKFDLAAAGAYDNEVKIKLDPVVVFAGLSYRF